MEMSELRLTPQELTYLQSLDPLDSSLLLRKKAESLGFQVSNNRLKADGLSVQERERKRKREWASKTTRELQDIGEPEITDAEREIGRQMRAACENDLLKFNTDCFPNSTGQKPFGDSQKAAIQLDQDVILNGGKLNKLIFRGSGKSSVTSNAAMWAALYGHTSFIPVFTAGQDRSVEIIEGWQTELISNDLLFWMFPDIIWPIRALQGSTGKARGQMFRGVRTHIRWTTQKIVFPSVEGEPGAGSIMVAKSWKSARGTIHRTVDGEVLRPSFCIIDDMQRDEDATSHTTVDKMLRSIRKTILYLGGHDSTLSVINNATPIEPNDVPEQLAEDDAWQTVRFPFMLEHAKNEELWLHDYANIKAGFTKGDKDSKRAADRKALEFYLSHREEMEEGCVVSWEWAYPWKVEDDPEKETLVVSAIQAAYDKLIEDEDSFQSELQVNPIRAKLADQQLADFPVLMSKRLPLKPLVLPQFTDKVVAHIDVQQNLLFFAIAGVSMEFEGSIVHWGGMPHQDRLRYTLNQIDPSIQDIYRGSITQQLYQAIKDGIKAIVGFNFVREDGTEMEISRIGVDARAWTRTVRKACRDSPFRHLVIPVMGDGVPAKKMPYSKRRVNEGETRGIEWKIRPMQGRNELIYDTNHWKSEIHNLLCAPPGGGATWYINDAQEQAIRQLADHFEAEWPDRVTHEQPDGGSRTVDEWMLKPRRNRNDHFDNAVACAVLASTLGCRMPEHEEPVKMRKEPLVVIRRRKK